MADDQETCHIDMVTGWWYGDHDPGNMVVMVKVMDGYDYSNGYGY